MVHFLSLQLTHKDSILHYKAVKVTINTPNFEEVILDVVVCRHNLPDWLLPIKTLSNVIICHCGFLDSVVTNVRRNYSTAFYLQFNGPTKRLNSSQWSIFLSFQLDDWQEPFRWLTVLTILQKMQALYMQFEQNCCYLLRVYSWYLPRVNAQARLKGKGGCTRLLRKCILVPTCHLTIVLISTNQYSICWDVTFLDSIPLGFGWLLIALQLQADNAFIDPFPSQVGGLWCGEEVSSIHTKL